MRFPFKDPFASQFRFFSQVFTSARGIVSIWGEGRVVGLCNGGGGMDLLKMTSQQLPPLFQRIRLVLLSVGWQWNVNRWHWTNLKTPCETCLYAPCFDIIYLEWSCSLPWHSRCFYASDITIEQSSWSSPEISEKYHLSTKEKGESGTSLKVIITLAILNQPCVTCTMLPLSLCLVICKS